MQCDDDTRKNADGGAEIPNESVGDILDFSKDDTVVRFAITGLARPDEENDMYSCWCKVSLKVKNHYFEYDKTNSELFDFRELMLLKQSLRKAARGKLKESEFIDFMEPELDFKINRLHVEFRINLARCNAQFYVIPLFEENVRMLREYIDSRIPLLRQQWEEAHNEESGVGKKNLKV